MLLLTVYKSPEDTTQYPKCTSGMTGITSCYRLLEKILENLELKKWLLDKIIPAWSSVQTTGVASQDRSSRVLQFHSSMLCLLQEAKTGGKYEQLSNSADSAMFVPCKWTSCPYGSMKDCCPALKISKLFFYYFILLFGILPSILPSFSFHFTMRNIAFLHNNEPYNTFQNILVQMTLGVFHYF